MVKLIKNGMNTGSITVISPLIPRVSLGSISDIVKINGKR